MLERNYKIVRNQKGGLEPTKIPTVLDVAWAAGIYEGEGSCVTNVQRKNYFTVQVTQKDPEFLYRLRDLFGGSVKPYMNGGFSINHWRASGNYARVFLACIFPYLTTRRRTQIEITGAKLFIDDVSHLMYHERVSSPCEINESLWKWLEVQAVESRKKAEEHKKARMADHHFQRSKNDPQYITARRLRAAARRAAIKEQKQKEQLLNVVEMKKTA